MMRIGYRPFAIAGGFTMLAGAILLAMVGANTGHYWIMASMTVLGFGLGFTSMPYLLSVQNAVPWNLRGVATSSVQFFRSIGGAVAVAALGAVFNARLAARMGGNLSIHSASAANLANTALDPLLRSRLAPDALAHLSSAWLHALQGVYVALAVAGAAALAIAFTFPRGGVQAHAHREGERAAVILGE